MNQGAGEFFDTKVDQFNSMKNILKVYTSYRKCSVQEAVYHILPELHLRRVFPGVQFVNTNLPEERSKILQTEEKLSSLPDDSTDIFKRNNIDCYLEDDQSGFVMENVAYLILFALHNLLHIYILQYKPKIIKLANSNEKMQRRKVRRVLRYHTPNKYRFPEKYAHHLLFFPVSIRKITSWRTFAHIPGEVS